MKLERIITANKDVNLRKKISYFTDPILAESVSATKSELSYTDLVPVNRSAEFSNDNKSLSDELESVFAIFDSKSAMIDVKLTVIVIPVFLQVQLELQLSFQHQ